MIELRIDGETVRVPDGSTILEAAKSAGIHIPTLCFLPEHHPLHTCRICSVEVEGSRTLVPACSRRVTEGMVIHTQSERVRRTRRTLLEMLRSDADLSLSPLQEVLQRVGVPDRLGTSPAPTPLRDNSLYMRDYSLCIRCDRCIAICGEEAQFTFALTRAGRGGATKVDTALSRSLPASDCVFCGNCVSVCPTGALITESEYRLRQEGRYDPASVQVTRTICPYCGVGCTLELHVQAGEVVKVTSPTDNPVTGGMLCVKGRFGYGFLQTKPAAE